MLVRRAAQCEELTAGDESRLRELLHPRNDTPDLPFSLAIARVEPGAATVPHRLAAHEVYYVLRGCAVMHVAAEVVPVAVGDAVHIAPAVVQWIENPGDEPLEFLAIVSPPWRAEDETVLAHGPGRA
ncbi:MAG: cupin domain-containing protein [Gammaproteobacteria bacterium]|nr:cupin domain-containing protein [Gammaproteobacteria bacterium]